ncbi:unnamed protein product, partial [Medioppia subpectinata]
TEKEIYRIDHYLGKEMVQNILALRFGNRQLEPTWNNEHIANVEVLFKEPFGTMGRGVYFDEYGMIRDVVQNHLLQVLALIAMERPEANDAEKIRDEKLYLLKHMKDLAMEDIVLGQYVGNPKGVGDATKGYTEDDTVKDKNSTTATYSLVTLHIDNDRWRGVPFFIRSGKATDESRVEVRVQYKPLAEDLFNGQAKRDMTIIRIQPNEAVYQRLNIKRPGMSNELIETELDLTYATRFHNAYLPDAYERLLLDVFNGEQANFVRTDELSEAWRVFTPALHTIEKEKKMPVKYVFGAQSFKEADDLEANTLYKEGLLPKNFQIAGFAHSKSSVEAIRKLVDPYVVNTLKNEHEKQLYEQFWKIVTYNSGDSQADKDYAPVVDIISKFEVGKTKGHRLVYFALPPSLFAKTALAVKHTIYSKTGWTRLVIEKPFGRDSESSKELSDALAPIFTEKEIYRIDHYLGKEMVQNILALRFGNRQLEPTWNNEHIANV